jgi:hypothetical protein
MKFKSKALSCLSSKLFSNQTLICTKCFIQCLLPHFPYNNIITIFTLFFKIFFQAHENKIKYFFRIQHSLTTCRICRIYFPVPYIVCSYTLYCPPVVTVVILFWINNTNYIKVFESRYSLIFKLFLCFFGFGVLRHSEFGIYFSWCSCINLLLKSYSPDIEQLDWTSLHIPL